MPRFDLWFFLLEYNLPFRKDGGVTSGNRFKNDAALTEKKRFSSNAALLGKMDNLASLISNHQRKSWSKFSTQKKTSFAQRMVEGI